MKCRDHYCTLRNKTNYEHLSQFVIPNWGTQSALTALKQKINVRKVVGQMTDLSLG